MAIIHITEAEAGKDLSSVLARVRSGQEVYIDSVSGTFAIVSTEMRPEKPRLLSEIIAALEERGSTATLPPGFAADVEDGIRSHEHERLTNPWEYF